VANFFSQRGRVCATSHTAFSSVAIQTQSGKKCVIVSDVDNVTEFSIRDNHTLLDNTSNIIQTISARVTDLAGNTSVVSDNITLDNITRQVCDPGTYCLNYI
jgi:hypothetical protein